MCSKAFSLLLSGSLIVSFLTPASAQSAQTESLRRKVIEWGTNKPITAQLKTGEKLKGRIAEIKFDTLAVQLLEQGKIVTRELPWDDLNKISLNSKDEKARKIGGFIAIGVLVTIAVVIGIALNDPDF